jgi:hypothetical protein
MRSIGRWYKMRGKCRPVRIGTPGLVCTLAGIIAITAVALPTLVVMAATADASKSQNVNQPSSKARDPQLFGAAPLGSSSKLPSQPNTQGSQRAIREAVSFIGQPTMTVSPSDVSTGDPVQLVFTYTAGTEGIKTG